MTDEFVYTYCKHNCCHEIKFGTGSATIALKLTEGEAERLLVAIAKKIGIARTLAVVADAIDERED